MRSYLTLWVLCLGLCPVGIKSVYGGDGAGNAAGIAEKYLTFAHLNMEKYIDLCLAAQSCGLEGKERVLLRKIRDALPRERENKKQLVFKSEKKQPGFFKIDGAVRVARTGDAVGSPIYINVDLLYAFSPFGKLEPISLATAVSLLIHEFGHHHNIKDHLKLDRLGSKVSALLKSQSQEVAVSPFQDHIRARSINFHLGEGNFTQLLLSAGGELVDLSTQLRSSLHCPGMADATISYLLIWNLHWMREYWLSQAPKAYNRHAIRGRLLLHCLGADGAKVRQDQDVVVDLGFDRDAKWKLVFVPEATKIRQVDCSRKPNDCH